MYLEKIKLDGGTEVAPTDDNSDFLRLDLARFPPTEYEWVCTKRNDRAEKFSTEHLGLLLCACFLTGAALYRYY